MRGPGRRARHWHGRRHQCPAPASDCLSNGLQEFFLRIVFAGVTMNLNIPHRMPLKYNKTWVVLSVAIAIGTIAALAARNFLSSQVEAIEARAKGKTVEVIVAKTDIAQGSKLS